MTNQPAKPAEEEAWIVFNPDGTMRIDMVRPTKEEFLYEINAARPGALEAVLGAGYTLRRVLITEIEED